MYGGKTPLQNANYMMSIKCGKPGHVEVIKILEAAISNSKVTRKRAGKRELNNLDQRNIISTKRQRTNKK